MYRLCVRNPASRLLQIGHKSERWQWRYILPKCCHHQFFDIALFLLSGLVTGPSFMSILSLVLELWQFSFIRDWPEICKSEMPPSEFYTIPGKWSELEIPNLGSMFLMKCYWMPQNARVTAYTVSLVLRETQQGKRGGGDWYYPTPTHPD